MGGILHNKSDENAEKASHPFDRKDVLENTMLNAKLGASGDEVRKELEKARSKSPSHPSNHTKYPKTKAPQALHWDEKGIEDHDLERGQTEKITEPKTPYQGTAQVTEYYDEDDIPAELDLGEAYSSAGPPVENSRITTGDS